MKVTSLIDDPEANGPGPIVSLGANTDEVIVQIQITAAATVKVLGRLHSSLPFVVLTTVTASAIVPLASVDDVQLDVSDNTDTVIAYVGAR